MNFRTWSDEEVAALQKALKEEISRRKHRQALKHQLQVLIEEIEEDGYTVYHGDTYITKDGIELVGG